MLKTYCSRTTEMAGQVSDSRRRPPGGSTVSTSGQVGRLAGLTAQFLQAVFCFVSPAVPGSRRDDAPSANQVTAPTRSGSHHVGSVAALDPDADVPTRWSRPRSVPERLRPAAALAQARSFVTICLFKVTTAILMRRSNSILWVTPVRSNLTRYIRS